MLSIIVPVYNSSKTIIECLLSVVNQEGFNHPMQIVIVNDGSNDGSESLIIEFMKKNPEQDIKYFYKTNGGVASARNVGISLSKYNWIAFLDSDDLWLPRKLFNQFNVVDNFSKNIDFLGCARNNEVLSILGKKVTSLHKATVFELLLKMYPQTSTAIIKKSILLEVGCYDEGMSHSEDGDLWLRICDKGDFYYMPESLVITGGGKHSFGESGLSGNLKAMHEGTIFTINKLVAKNKLSKTKALFLSCFIILNT